MGYEGEAGLFGADPVQASGAHIYNPQFEWGGGGVASTPRDRALTVLPRSLTKGSSLKRSSCVTAMVERPYLGS